MQTAQIVAHGVDGRWEDHLRAWAEQRKIWWRPVRHASAGLNLLRRGGVLLLKVGRDLDRELALLERTATLYPEVPCLVIGESEHPAVTALIWDLGASWVAMPPTSPAEVAEVLARWLP